MRNALWTKIFCPFWIAPHRARLSEGGVMELKSVKIRIPEGCNIILGQTHFIKTAEDLYETIVSTVPHARFGIAFTEASGPCLVRTEGNDNELITECARTVQDIGAGHVFCILLKDAYPVNVLNPIKNCQEVCSIYCATANPLDVVVACTAQGNGIMGVVDGFPPAGVEGPEDKANRRDFLRAIGYKL
jgi:adenosine/AMP kinase